MKDTNKTTDKPKRGRRSKKEILAAASATQNQVNEILDHSIVHDLILEQGQGQGQEQGQEQGQGQGQGL